MDLLPLELIYKIFDLLKVKDLFRLRLLSKKWNYLVLNFKMKCIDLSGLENQFFKHSTNKKWLLNLKKVKLSVRREHYGTKIENINQLINLEHLELTNCFDKKKELKLPNLKFLSLHSSSELIVITPKLTHLRVFKSFPDHEPMKTKFIHKDCVTNLIINEVESFKMFKKVKCIRFWGQIEASSSYICLSYFSELEELHICRCYPSYFVDGASYIINLDPYPDNESFFASALTRYFMDGEKRPALLELLTQKERLKMKNLKIYLKGMDISKSKGIFERDGFEKKRLSEFIVENFKHTKDLGFLKVFNYYRSMVAFDFPDSFMKKLSKVAKLNACQFIQDQMHFLSLVGKLWRFSNLKELHLDCTSLGQTFFDQLSAVCSLKFLSVYDETDLNLNYEFLMKMKALKRFDTDQKVPLEIIRLKLSSLERGKFFEFYFDGPTLMISKLVKCDNESNKTASLCESFIYELLKLYPNSTGYGFRDHPVEKFDELNKLVEYLVSNLVLENRKKDYVKYLRYEKGSFKRRRPYKTRYCCFRECNPRGTYVFGGWGK